MISRKVAELRDRVILSNASKLALRPVEKAEGDKCGEIVFRITSETRLSTYTEE